MKVLLAALWLPLTYACTCTPFATTGNVDNTAYTCLPTGTCSSSLSPLQNGLAQNWAAPQTCPSGQFLDGAGLNCQTLASNGQSYQSGCSTGSCFDCSCPTPGTYVATCQSLYTYQGVAAGYSNFACGICNNKPINAQYVSSSSILLQQECGWQCPSGTFYNGTGTRCVSCTSACPAGQTSTQPCTQAVNTNFTIIRDQNIVCGPCANSAHVVSYASGCSISSCAPGYTVSNGFCVTAASPPPSPPPSPNPPFPPAPDHNRYADCGSTLSIIGVTGTSSTAVPGGYVLRNTGSTGQANLYTTSGSSFNGSAAVLVNSINNHIDMDFTTSSYASYVLRLTVDNGHASSVLLSDSGFYISIDSTGVYAGSKKLVPYTVGATPAIGQLLNIFVTCAVSNLFCFGVWR
jgi:hypothetical protein